MGCLCEEGVTLGKKAVFRQGCSRGLTAKDGLLAAGRGPSFLKGHLSFTSSYLPWRMSLGDGGGKGEGWRGDAVLGCITVQG